MEYSISALLAHARRRASADGVRWRFEVDRSAAPARVAWHWERYDAAGMRARSLEAFPSFADCAADARSHGFDASQPYTLSDRPSMPASAWAAPARDHATRRDDSAIPE